jgi:hypothetical protein
MAKTRAPAGSEVMAPYAWNNPIVKYEEGEHGKGGRAWFGSIRIETHRTVARFDRIQKI